MPKEQRLRYERLNRKYGEKYGLTPTMTGAIRSQVITYKKTKEEIIAQLLDRTHGLAQEIDNMEEKLKERRRTVDILLKITPEEFDDITSIPKRFVKDKADDSSKQG